MDKHLAFTKYLTDDELWFLVQTMLQKGELTETLSVSDEYKAYGGECTKYTNRIIEEYLAFSSNTFRPNNSYAEIIRLVAKRCKVKFDKYDSVEEIEEALLDKIFHDTYEKMTTEERAAFITFIESSNAPGASSTSLISLHLFRMGGFGSYKASVILANAVSKAILGRGLSFGMNTALTKALSVAVGPIGIVLTTLWSAWDLAGPAYRVMVPCTITLALYRRIVEVRLKDPNFTE